MNEAKLSQIEKRYADVRAYGEHCGVEGRHECLVCLPEPPHLGHEGGDVLDGAGQVRRWRGATTGSQ